MKTTKQLGIWMDHAHAHIIDLSLEEAKDGMIASKFTHEVKEESLHHGENHMHNKEKGEQQAYYNELGEVIKNYEDVLLFGPTDAKMELMNLLLADTHFAKIKISVRTTDDMTENERAAYVKDYFEKN